MAHDKDHHEDEQARDVSYISNEEVAHEESDVKIRPIVWFLVWLTVAAIIIHLLMAGLYNVLEDRVEAEQGEPSPMASEREIIPPEPRLQLAPTDPAQGSPRFREDHPLNDLRKLRAEEEAKLKGHAFDPATGTARIPIEEAKELVLRSGALNQPAAEGTGSQRAGDQRPSRSSSGRLPERIEPQSQQKTGGHNH
jgi:hypothetical protein